MGFVKKYPFIVIILFFVFLYGFSAARDMTGFGDSDELIAAGYSLALPHPPGYPLLMGMIYGVTHVLPLPPAQSAHFLAVIFMAASIGLVMMIWQRNYSFRLPMQLVILGGLLVGSSKLIWEHGIHIEVFGLLSLLSLLIFWLIIGIEKKKGFGLSRWFWLGLTMGVGLMHHQLLILTVGPQLVWLFFRLKRYKNCWKQWGMLVSGLVVGGGMSLLLLWALGLQQNADSWRFVPSLTSLWKFVLRSDFSGYSVAQGEMSAYLSGVSMASVWASVQFYALSMWRYWGITLIFGILGVIYGQKSKAFYYWPILASFIFSGPLLAGYLSMPHYLPYSVEYEISLATIERMFVLSQLWWGLLSMFGVVWFFTYLKRSLVLVYGGIIALLVFMVLVWQQRSLANYSFASTYADVVVSDLSDGSEVLCFSDISCFGLYYKQLVLSKFEPIHVSSQSLWYRYGYQNDQPYEHFLADPFRLGEVIAQTKLAEKEVVVAQINAQWMDELGLDGQAFYLIPDGNLRFVVAKELGESVFNYRDGGQRLVELYLSNEMPDYRYVKALEAVVAEQHLLSGYRLAQLGQEALAEREMNYALTYQPNNPHIRTVLAQIKQTDMRNSLTIYGETQLIEELQDCIKKGDVVCELKRLNYLIWRNPTQGSWRRMRATFFEQDGRPDLAEVDRSFIVEE